MKQARAAGVAMAIAAALLLTACGGHANNNPKNAPASPVGNGGAHVKQLNPLHVAHNYLAGGSLQINMGQVGHSGESGNASVVAKKGGVEVTIHVNEPKGAVQPAHIHKGSCAHLNPAPWKMLSNVVNGTSQTFVPGVTVGQLKGMTDAINVHKSITDLKTYVACGDLHA